MRYLSALALVAVAVLSIPSTNFSQGGQTETSRGVAGGGISVEGWTGKIDAKEAAAGMTINSAKLSKEGDALMVTTGPAVTYWNPKNKATGMLGDLERHPEIRPAAHELERGSDDAHEMTVIPLTQIPFNLTGVLGRIGHAC